VELPIELLRRPAAALQSRLVLWQRIHNARLTAVRPGE
jgi:hypothetical protein